MKALSVVLVSAFFLASCTGTRAPDLSQTLGNRLAIGGGSYSSGGGLTVAASLSDLNGMTAVCGIWAQSQNQSILTKHRAKQVLTRGVVTVGGEVIARDLTFMREVAPTGEYAGELAHCRVTERPWSGTDASGDFAVHIPRQVVHLELNDVGVGFAVWFRPDGPGAEIK